MGLVTTNLNVVPQTLSKFPAYLLSNWIRKVETETIYQTRVNQGVDGKESRHSVTVRPQRFIMLRLSAFNSRELSHLNSMLLRNTQQIIPVPVYSDIKPVTGQTTNVLTVDTTYTRFQANGRVAVFYLDGSAEVTSVEFFTVLFLTTTSLTLSGTPTAVGSYQQMLVVPCIDCEIRLQDRRLNGLTDGVQYVDAPFKEYFDESSLRPLTNYTPALFESDPVFEFDHNWKNNLGVDIRGIGEESRLGKTAYHKVQGARPLHKFTLKSLFSSREDTFKFLSFFDYVKGRLAPFWFINPFTYWEIDSLANGNEIILKENNLSVDDVKDHFPYIYLVNSQGVRTIVPVLDVTVFSDKLKILIGTEFTSQQTFVSASPVHYCRFGRDAVREVWSTDGVCEISYVVQEILDDPTLVTAGYWGGKENVTSFVVDGFWGGDNTNATVDGFSGGSE